ncbi:MAG: hypothetical protein ABI461_04405 [Polyangiaceae bacterium]
MNGPIASVALFWLPLLVAGGGCYLWLLKTGTKRRLRRNAEASSALERQRDNLNDLFANGDFEAAEQRARALLANPNAKPLHAVAHFRLATIEERRGNFAAMKTHLQEVMSAFSRAPVPPTEAEAREHRTMQELVSLNLAFALAATSKIDEAERELAWLKMDDASHASLALRVRAVILARREEWETLALALAVDMEDDPNIGPSTKLLFRVLRRRCAAHAYRTSGSTDHAVEVAPEADDDHARLEWVEKALGELQ